MGTYHTFFVADESRLDQLFPGWKPALATARSEPLFGEPLADAWEPAEGPSSLQRPALHDDVWGAALEPVIPIANELLARLEADCPPGLRAVPHFRTKDCQLLLDLGRFAKTVGLELPAPPARVGPRPSDRVDALPAPVATRLAALDEPALLALAGRVVAGDPEQEWNVDDFAYSILAPLQLLAREAQLEHARVCHYWHD